MENKYFENQIEKNEGIYYTNIAYEETIRYNFEYLIIFDIPFGSKLEEESKIIINELLNANIKKIVISNQSTELVSFLFELNKNGWGITGLYKRTYVDKWKHEKEIKGIILENE